MNDSDAIRSATRQFGRTGLAVSPVCLGTSSWGPERTNETPQQAQDRIARVADEFFAERLETNFIDTSNEYGGLLSEGLIGDAILRVGALPEGIVLQTKLDRDTLTGDFSGDRMWRSLEESQERLGIERFDILYLHDPENIGFDASMAKSGTVEALVEMKARGLAASIGISGGPVDMLQQFVETDLFDALITHNRFTLVDRSAESLLAAASARDLGIANAAPYGAGVLTGDPRFAGTYGYAPIRPRVQIAVDRISELCLSAGVTMAALALQFSLRDPRIHSTIVGASSLGGIQRALEESHERIPDELWIELEEFLPVPGGLDSPE